MIVENTTPKIGKMKLLIFCHALSVDGATMLVKNYLHNKNIFSKYSDVLVVSRRGNEMISEFQSIGCNVVTLQYPDEGLKQYLKKPYENIKRLINLLITIIKSDFVWINSLDHTATLFSACKFLKKKGFIYAHEGLGSPFAQHFCDPFKLKTIKNLLDTGMFKIIFPSKKATSDGIRKIGIQSAIYVPSAIESNISSKPIFNNNIVRFINVGWVCERKGQYLMKYVLRELEKKVMNSNGNLNDFVFTFSGIHWIINDHFMHDILAHVSPSRVRFTEIMPNHQLLEELNNNDVLVSNSFNEALPINVMEAMMLGKLVIASNCEGQDELILSENTGLGYSMGDFTQLFNHMLACLNPNNYKKLHQIALNGKSHIMSNYNYDSYRNNLDNIIKLS